MQMFRIEQNLAPIVKWPGGKQSELNSISSALPFTIKNYYEPFVGGGSVYLSIPSSIPAFINDKSSDLMNLYQMIAKQDEAFFDTLNFILNYWQLLENILVEDLDGLLNTFNMYRVKQTEDHDFQEAINDFISRNSTHLEQPLKMHLPQDVSFFIASIRESLHNKMKRMSKLEQKLGQLERDDIHHNLESALKAAFYYYTRHLYNCSAIFNLEAGQQAAIFYFVRENAYASMFRFNNDGLFNIPYGGISYNRKNLRAKVDNLQSPLVKERLANTTFGNMDFADFLMTYPPDAGDFVFLDPPYDTEFSSYDQNTFGQLDQKRLADFLINKCRANFMLVIKSTPFILSLYEGHNLNISSFGKKYMYTVKERNNRDATHLLITNY